MRRWFVVGFVVLWCAAAVRLPVAFDEAYYWTWSKDLGWSYFDHPPFVAWAIAVFRSIFGDGKVALRLLSASCVVTIGLVSVATTYRLVPAADRRRAGWLTVLTLLGSMMFVVGYLPATPDVLQGAWLAVAAYATVRGFSEPKWAFVAALLLGAGVLVKHSTGLIAVGVMVALVLQADGRRALSRLAPWLGLALALAVVIPWWLVDAEGATAFQTGRVLGGGKTRGLLAVPLTVGAMLLTLGVPVTAALFAALRGSPRARVLAGGSLGLVIGCVGAAWFGAGEVNWVMPALVFGLPAAITCVSQRFQRWYERVTWATSVLWLLGLVHIVWPYLPIEPDKDRTLRPAGFDLVAHRAAELARAHRATTIVARRYQIASMMRFHLNDAWPVLELGTSRASQYDRWSRPSVCAGSVAVVVLPAAEIPFAADALAPTELVTRQHGGRAITTYAVTPVRVRENLGGCRP